MDKKAEIAALTISTLSTMLKRPVMASKTKIETINEKALIALG